MPELPEVEITRQGILARLAGRRARQVVVRQPRLRWPVPSNLARSLPGQTLASVERRAKYLLMRFDAGTLIVHLGMSGSLRVLEDAPPPGPHDHVDIIFDGATLRLRDPRRFGAVLWQAGAPEAHPLLRGLGVEPLSDRFDGDVLHRASRGRVVAIKQLIMNAAVVVGVGNIYASESLFRAGIHPRTRAGRLSRPRCDRLAQAIRATLSDALAAGGSTLRDFSGADGAPGYFQQRYFVYDRAGEPCRACGGPIRGVRMGQRSTFYCPVCQKP